MELSEIYQKLCTVGVPVAYLRFRKPQKLPYIVYYESGSEIRGADGHNMLREVNVTVELYFEVKDITIERKIENLFRDTEITRSPDIWLDDEKMYMTSYSFDTYQFIEEE